MPGEYCQENWAILWGTSWKDREGVPNMVKGINKHAILVKTPDPNYFEEAIFILREEAFARGVSAEQVLQEAQQAARSYLRGSSRPAKWLRQIPGPAYAAAGALAATAAWSLALFF